VTSAPRDLPLRGAVDLSTLNRPAPAAGAPAAAPGALVIDVTEASFETEVVNRSMQVPVVIDFWADWCGPCKQLSPVLEKLASEGGGRWVLAKIDVDAQPRLSQAFQIQSIPSVMAVIGGQPVPLFQGAVSEQQARQVIDEVLRVAAANGVSGTVEAAEPTEPAPDESGVDPRYADAEAALDRGDLEAALAAFRVVLEHAPADPIALAGVARCELLLRVRGVDEAAARARAAGAPDDVDAALVVADLDLADGRVDEAIGGLVDLVRRSAGDDRERARLHLVELFAVLDPQDPRLAAGRRALANALF